MILALPVLVQESGYGSPRHAYVRLSGAFYVEGCLAGLTGSVSVRLLWIDGAPCR